MRLSRRLLSILLLCASSALACGLALTGAVYCWGSDNLGQLGSGVAQPNILHVAPSPVAGDDIFSALAGNGFATACGMSSDGAALCWGSNALGEFGTESPETGAFAPTRVRSYSRRHGLLLGFGRILFTRTRLRSAAPLPPRVIAQTSWRANASAGPNQVAIARSGEAAVRAAFADVDRDHTRPDGTIRYEHVLICVVGERK
jgi:hypothetical protein